jgi:chromosome partitioning protein
MPFRRRNRHQPAPPPEPQAEERFFEESDSEWSPAPELEPEVAVPEAPPEVVAEQQPPPAELEPEVAVPEAPPEVVAEQQPPPAEPSGLAEPDVDEVAIEPLDQPEYAAPPASEIAPPPVEIPPLPTAVPTPVEPPAPDRPPEPAAPRQSEHHAAHARQAPPDNFSERAQIAISRLGELPGSNGARRTRPLPRVVAIANQKGGVGKTTTTVNLGAALSELDYRVLVVDLDPQGNATSGLGIDTRNFESSMYDVIMRDAPIEDCIEPTSVQNLFVTPATIDLAGVEIELVSAFSRELKLKRAIDTVVDDFDFVLIDCPPSLGLLTINGLAAANEVLVPIQCEYYALEGLSQLIRNVQLVATNLNMGLEISAIVLTMFDARTRLAIDVADEVRSHFKEVVCRSIIPRTVRLSEAPSFGQPITVFDPSSRGAVAYRELAKEVSDGAPKRSG